MPWASAAALGRIRPPPAPTHPAAGAEGSALSPAPGSSRRKEGGRPGRGCEGSGGAGLGSSGRPRALSPAGAKVRAGGERGGGCPAETIGAELRRRLHGARCGAMPPRGCGSPCVGLPHGHARSERGKRCGKASLPGGPSRSRSSALRGALDPGGVMDPGGDGSRDAHLEGLGRIGFLTVNDEKSTVAAVISLSA